MNIHHHQHQHQLSFLSAHSCVLVTNGGVVHRNLCGCRIYCPIQLGSASWPECFCICLEIAECCDNVKETNDHHSKRYWHSIIGCKKLHVPTWFIVDTLLHCFAILEWKPFKPENATMSHYDMRIALRINQISFLSLGGFRGPNTVSSATRLAKYMWYSKHMVPTLKKYSKHVDPYFFRCR